MNATVITTQQGKIKGKTDLDLDGRKFYKFLGIPYAKPPIGSLRFKAPQPPDSWIGLRDCTSEGNPCLSANRLSLDELVGSEDCLYLNVFTKQLPQAGFNLKPVMVFIHGGAFTLGSGSEDLYGAHYLMTQDIVLVTINYRLGILGFLSSDDLSLEVPGNAGLKDQTFALRWVQKNIASFNGDPKNVTIFGVSAGGASVSLQVLSPTAKGLFHKAIAQSGCALNPWVWGNKNAVEVAKKLEKKVSTEKEALKILMKVTAEELMKASLQIPDLNEFVYSDCMGLPRDGTTNYIQPTKEVMNASKKRPFGPVIEKPNPTAFLTENPILLLASGKFNQIPMIQGVVSNEGMIYEMAHMGSPFKIEDGNEVPWSLNIDNDSSKRKNIAALVNTFYFKDGIDKESCYKFAGDVNFVHGVIESTKLMSETSSQPIFLYVYSQEVSLSNVMRTIYGIEDDTIKGVAHGGDQMVLFHTDLMELLGVKMTEESKEAVKQLVTLWADFARTGKPHKHWEPVTDPENLKYLDINESIMLKANPFSERVAFWENVFKTYSDINKNVQSKAKL